MEDIAIGSLRVLYHDLCRTTMLVTRLCIALLVTILCSTRSNAQDRISLYRSPMLSPCHENNKARQTFVRDPLDCSLFYTCFGNRFWKMSCTTPGTVYSLKYKVCVWRNSLYDDCTNSREEESIESNIIDDKKHVPDDLDSKSLFDSKTLWLYKSKDHLHPSFTVDTKDLPPSERKGNLDSNQIEDAKDAVTKQPRPQSKKDKKNLVLKKSRTTFNKKDKDSPMTKDKTGKWSKQTKETLSETLKSLPIDDKTNTIDESSNPDSDYKKSAEDLNSRRVIHNDDKPQRRRKPQNPPRNPFITPSPWWQSTTTSLHTTPMPSKISTTSTTPTRRTPPLTTFQTRLRNPTTVQVWKVTAKPQRRWRPNTHRFTSPPTSPVTTPRPLKWWELSKSTTSPPQRQQQREPTRGKTTPVPRPKKIPEAHPTAHLDRGITPSPSLPPQKRTSRLPRQRTTPALRRQQQQSTILPPQRNLTLEPRQPRPTQQQQTQIPPLTEPTPMQRPKQNEGETLQPPRRKFIPYPRRRHHQQKTLQPPPLRPVPTTRPDRQRRPTPQPWGQSPYPITRPPVTRLPNWWRQKIQPVTKTPPHHRRRPKPSKPQRSRQRPDHLKIRTTPEPIRWWRPTTRLPRRQRVTTPTTTSKPGRWWVRTPSPSRPPFLKKTTTIEPMTRASTTTMASVWEVRYTWKTSPNFRVTRPITIPTIVSTTAPPPPPLSTTTTLSTTRTTTPRPTTAAPTTMTTKAVTRMSTLPHRAQMAGKCFISHENCTQIHGKKCFI